MHVVRYSGVAPNGTAWSKALDADARTGTPLDAIALRGKVHSLALNSRILPDTQLGRDSPFSKLRKRGGSDGHAG
jgi:hypothetical protein